MRLIDADALEDVLVNHGFYYRNESDYSDGVAWGFLLARDDVREAPTIDAELIRHGKWIWEGSAWMVHTNSARTAEQRWTRWTMVHKWHIWYDFLLPILNRMVGKKYGCCDKIRNCRRCLARMYKEEL